MASNEHEGHRKRLRERFEKSGIAGFHDYEILELLLSYAIPYKDTKPISKELLKRFGGFSSLINASTWELEQVAGIGKRSALLFPLLKEIFARCLQEQYREKDILSNRTEVDLYLRHYFGFRNDEYIAAFFLDNRNHIVGHDIIAEGTVNQCAIYPRKVIEKALQYSAAAFVLAHNHPAGGLEPSDADWEITNRLFRIGKLLEIHLLDHIIVTKSATVSLKSMPRWPSY